MLHSFVGYAKSDGAYPLASLVNTNGTLYGTTSEGGAYHSSGTIFSVTTGGNEKALHSFGEGTDGNDPNAGLIELSGTLYGTTSAGGTYGEGTVFVLKP